MPILMMSLLNTRLERNLHDAKTMLINDGFNVLQHGSLRDAV